MASSFGGDEEARGKEEDGGGNDNTTLQGKGWERKRNSTNFFEKEQVERGKRMGVSSTTLSTFLGESS